MIATIFIGLLWLGAGAGWLAAELAARWPDGHKDKSIHHFHGSAIMIGALISVPGYFFLFNGVFLVLLGLVTILLYASLVDIRTRLLPDLATLGLIPLGLAAQFWLEGWHGVGLGVLGAAIGYGALWLLAFLYRRLRGHDGLGLGDAKLLAAGGAWCGPFALSWIVLIAASLALVFLLLRQGWNWLRRRKTKLDRHTSLPFGPFLAIGIYGAFYAGLLMGGHGAPLMYTGP